MTDAPESLRDVLRGAAQRGWLAGFRFKPPADRDDAMADDVDQIAADMERRLAKLTVPGGRAFILSLLFAFAMGAAATGLLVLLAEGMAKP